MTDDTHGLTPSQAEALDKAFDILEEHFKAGVITVVVDARNDAGSENDAEELRAVRWFGGGCAALGLCRKAQLVMEKEDDE